MYLCTHSLLRYECGAWCYIGDRFPWEKGRVSKEAREVQYVKRVLDACLLAHVVFPFLSIAEYIVTN